MTDYDLYLRFDFSKIRHLLHVFLPVLSVSFIYSGHFDHFHSPPFIWIEISNGPKTFSPSSCLSAPSKKGQSLRINHSFSVSFCGFFSFHKHSSDRTFSFSPMISFKTAHFSKAFSLLWLFLVMIKTRAFITLPVLSSQKRKEENYEPTRNLQTCLYPPRGWNSR